MLDRVVAILRGLGLPHAGLEPAPSFSHAVWLTRDHAVHCHVLGAVGRLEHEARVARRLPPRPSIPASWRWGGTATTTGW